MEYIDKQFPLEYVENDWDNFLSEKVDSFEDWYAGQFHYEKVNGERVRYFKFYRLIPYDDTIEGCINDLKKLQVLSKNIIKSVVDTDFGRTFFNISYKVVDGFKYPYYDGKESYTLNEDYVKRHFPNTYIDCKLVCFNLKIASFTDYKEENFAGYKNQPITVLESHIADTLGFERFEKVNSALTKVVDKNGEPLVVYHRSSNKFNTFDVNKIVDKNEYLKSHPLTDKFGIPFEIGDYVASGAGSAAIICKVEKLNPSTINWGISPKSCIIVRAKDPNKKLGW